MGGKQETKIEIVAYWELIDSSAVSVFAMLHTRNLDGVFSLEVEKCPVIAATEPEPCERRLEFFHIAGAVVQVPINAVKNLQSSVTLDNTNIARASGDQITAIRSGAASSLTASVRTRGGSRHARCLRRERVKRGHDPAPPRFQA